MTDQELLPCAELEPEKTATAAVIWLHGLGADGNDFLDVVPMLGIPKNIPTRFVFPHAPVRPVTLNMGHEMRAWYDIEMMDDKRHYRDDDILLSSRQIYALLDREIKRGVASERIVLAGFSQGGAIALHAGLRYQHRLAGLMALSTYMVRDDEIDAEQSDANREVAVFQAHGQYDPMVPFAWGESARDRLISLGHSVEFHAYPMEHQVVPEEITAIGDFLRRQLSGANA
ncbi:MAG: carboxylesterase [Planctomycetota bacterium]